MCVVNEGGTPPSQGRKEVLDLTFCNSEISNLISNWHVSKEPSLSDHNHIIFELSINALSTIENLNPRKTDWESFSNLVAIESIHLPLIFKSLYELERGAQQLNSILINCYNKSTSLVPRTIGKPIWWSPELTRLRSVSRK